MTDTNKKQDNLTGNEPLATRNREEFCQLYVVSPLNIGGIYRQAGYKPSSMDNARKDAYKLLRVPDVKLRIAFLVAERNERLGLDADNVIRGLFDSRDRCANSEILRDRQGKPITVEIDVKGVNIKHAVLWQFNANGFHKASELLARYFGILTDKVVVDDVRQLATKYDNEAEDIVESMVNSDNMTYTPTKKTSIDESDIIIPTDDSGKVDEYVKQPYKVVDEHGKEHKGVVTHPLRKDNGKDMAMA